MRVVQLFVAASLLATVFGQAGAATAPAQRVTQAAPAQSPARRILQLDADHGVLTGGSLDVAGGQCRQAEAALPSRDDFELLVWARTDQSPSSPATLYCESPAGGGQPTAQLILTPDGKAVWKVSNGKTSAEVASPAPVGKTLLLAATCRGDRLSLSVDNTALATAAAAQPLGELAAVQATIGVRPQGGSMVDPFDGQIGTIAVFSPVLSAEERALLYNGGKGRAYSELEGELKAKCRRWYTWGGPADYVHVDQATGARVKYPLSRPEPPAMGTPLTADGQEAVHQGCVTRWVDQAGGRVFHWEPGLQPMKYIDGPVSVSAGEEGALVSHGNPVISGRSRFALFAKTEQLSVDEKDRVFWSEIAADGSGVLWLVKAGGIQSLRYLGPSGRVQAEVDATDSIHGWRKIESSTRTIVEDPDPKFNDPLKPLRWPLTRIRLDIGANHRFCEMDRVRLVGAGEFYDDLEFTVTRAEPEEGCIHLVKEHEVPEIKAGAMVVNTGYVEHQHSINAEKTGPKFDFCTYAATATAFSRASSVFLLPWPDRPRRRKCSRMVVRRRVMSMSRNDGCSLVGYQGSTN